MEYAEAYWPRTEKLPVYFAYAPFGEMTMYLWDKLLPSLRHAIKSAFAPVLYKNPPFCLQPERLYVWLDALEETRALPDPVVEIGCHMAGTSVIAHKMLKQTGVTKRYICIDTFGGFVDDQFAIDNTIGTPQDNRYYFSANSMGLVRRITEQHDAGEIELVQADICKYDALPDGISACLLDVDLSVPTYEGMKKVYAKLVPGGVICVDDCPPEYDWKAREGYTKFCAEFGLPESYRYGMGMVCKSRANGSTPSALKLEAAG